MHKWNTRGGSTTDRTPQFSQPELVSARLRSHPDFGLLLNGGCYEGRYENTQCAMAMGDRWVLTVAGRIVVRAGHTPRRLRRGVQRASDRRARHAAGGRHDRLVGYGTAAAIGRRAGGVSAERQRTESAHG